MAFRKYPSFRRTPHRVSQLVSQGAPSATQQTVVPRRRKQLGYTRNSVQTLPNYGPIVSGSTDGSLSVTIGAITVTSAGAADISGALSSTLGAVTLIATSAGEITGSLSITLGAISLLTQAVTYYDVGELDAPTVTAFELKAAQLLTFTLKRGAND